MFNRGPQTGGEKGVYILYLAKREIVEVEPTILRGGGPPGGGAVP